MLQSCRMSECLWNGRITAYNAISRETIMKWRSDVHLLYIFPKSLVCVKPILALPKESDPHLGGINLEVELWYGAICSSSFRFSHHSRSFVVVVVVLFVCELITSRVVWAWPRYVVNHIFMLASRVSHCTRLVLTRPNNVLFSRFHCVTSKLPVCTIMIKTLILKEGEEHVVLTTQVAVSNSSNTIVIITSVYWLIPRCVVICAWTCFSSPQRHRSTSISITWNCDI